MIQIVADNIISGLGRDTGENLRALREGRISLKENAGFRVRSHELSDLGNGGEDNDTCDREGGLRKHECSVVTERIEHGVVDPCGAEGDEFLVIRPEHDTGEEVDEETDHAHACGTEDDTCAAFFAKQSRQPENREGKNVVKAYGRDKHAGREAPRENFTLNHLKP